MGSTQGSGEADQSSEQGSEHSGPPQAVVTIAALAAGVVAHRIVSAGWKFVRGTQPGKDDSPLPEILIFAAVTAATAAVARNWATHRAQRIGS